MTSQFLFDIELEKEDEIEIDAPFPFQEIEKELKEYLLKQQVEGDSTDGAFDFLHNLTIRLQENFDEIIGEDNDKKGFIKSLTRIFAIQKS